VVKGWCRHLLRLHCRTRLKFLRRPRKSSSRRHHHLPATPEDGARYLREVAATQPQADDVAERLLSFTHDASKKGAPTGFRISVREVRASVGAGFLYPILGDMRTMPGLPSHPAGEKIDIDADGNVVGLF